VRVIPLEYEAVIGLEVHAELLTDSKLFCGCSTEFGAEPNSHCCPVCLGLPGVLPVVNEKAVEYTIKTALALNCQIADYCRFARKNYYYPDLPKNYQISQYELPLSRNGHLDINVEGQTKRIGITRVHLEEDTGKLFHTDDNQSLLDYNRCGVPLMEIVSEPDIRTAAEARAYLIALRAILRYLGVNDGKMEEGSLRCEPNISVRPKGSDEFGVKVEIKNLSSIKVVHDGIQYEVERQIHALEHGEKIVQETRRWDTTRGVTATMRVKETADDYRYFPEPDLVPLVPAPEWVEQIRASLPELPDARRRRFVEQYHIPEYDADVLTQQKEMADFYEACVAEYEDPKAVSNWLMGDFMRLLNDRGIELSDAKVTPSGLADMLGMIKDGTISSKIAKTVFEEMFDTGADPKDIVEQKGLQQMSDAGRIEAIVDQVIEENPSVADDIRNGNKKAVGFLVGQVMKATQGKANPRMVNEMLREKLGLSEA